jgi:hypothetical protein
MMAKAETRTSDRNVLPVAGYDLTEFQLRPRPQIPDGMPKSVPGPSGVT